MAVMAWRGTKAMLAALKRYEQQEERKRMVRLRMAGLYVRRLSQKEVPVRTGNLKGSAFTQLEKLARSHLREIVGYRASYAWWVHENLKARHKRGKKAKYLEDPLKAAAGNIARILATGRLPARGGSR